MILCSLRSAPASSRLSTDRIELGNRDADADVLLWEASHWLRASELLSRDGWDQFHTLEFCSPEQTLSEFGLLEIASENV